MTDPSEPTAERTVPGTPVVVAAGVWAALAGTAVVFAEGDVRLVAFLLAAWPPVVVLLASMREVDPLPHWRRMAAGVICLVLAATVGAVTHTRGLVTPARAGVAEGIYALGYGLLASGLWTLVRRNGRDEVRAGILDGLVMLIPPVLLLAQYVTHVPEDGEGVASWTLRLLAAGYALFDLVLLAALVWLLAAPGLTRSHLGLLVAGMALTLAADMMVSTELLSPAPGLRGVAEGTYPLTYALLAAGVATGASTRVGRPQSVSLVHWGRVGLLAFGAILGPIVVVVAAMPPEPLPVLWVGIAVVGTSSFIVWRMLDLARFLGVTTTQLARARHELQVQATHDPLTGLLNRAVLDDVLDDLGDTGSRPAALLSVDLDLFKAVNDAHGHAAGDEVLRTIARRLRSALRPDDLVLRMGGDEFLAVLRNVGNGEARTLADRIVAEVEQPIRYQHVELAVSASVGIALLGPEDDSESPEWSVARADAAMYRAKRMGGGSSGSVAQAPDANADPIDSDGATVGSDEESADRTRTRPTDPQR